MSDISLETVTGKLNRLGYDAFIQALRLAKGAGNRNLELAHYFHTMLAQDRSDLALTVDHYKLDRARLGKDLADIVEGFRKNETEMPNISNQITDLLDSGWKYATLISTSTSDCLRSIAFSLPPIAARMPSACRPFRR